MDKIKGTIYNNSRKYNKGNEMRKRKGVVFILLLMSLGFIFLMPKVLKAQASDNEVKEILIKVQPRIIALPKNVEIDKVPLLSARVRSIELRELCNQYNAVSIKRLFEIKEESKKSKAVEDSFISKEKEKTKEKVDPAKVFTKEKKQELLTQEQNVIEAKDTFLIQFEPGEGVDMKQVAGEYAALPEVLFAEYVEAVGEEAK